MENMKIYKRRDLTVIELKDGRCIVISCDSCGGVGEKDGDFLKAPAETVGMMAVRTALMEVIASGADVISVCDAVCAEMNDTGRKIISGIKTELKKADISPEVLNGSTEENFPAVMTGVGVTVIGLAHKERLRFERAVKNDLIVVLGEPKVGAEVLGNELIGYQDIYKLLENKNIKEIVPVGSKGILYEAALLAEMNGLKLNLSGTDIDLTKSAGPATCFIALISGEHAFEYKNCTLRVRVAAKLE